MSDTVDDEKFADLLKSKRLKNTSERKIIFKEARAMKRHFDAEEFFSLLKKKGYRVARDTVYRTLPLLLEAGAIQKSVGKGKGDYFERVSGKGHHDHMVCIACGSVIEFFSPEIEKIQSEVCQKYGFRLVFHDHRLFGNCRNC
jgi:Fur family ferric uptake transcriptional regulator